MARAPSIAELRHYVDIQQPVVSVDSHGQTVRTWQNVEVKLPAKMTVKSHSSRDGGDKQVGWQETIFTIRARVGFWDTYRVVYEGRYYAIQGIADIDGSGKWLEIKTELNTNRGEPTV